MSADQVYSVANWVLVGALVVGVLSTYAIVVSGNIRDAALRRELAGSKERTAQLEGDAARARLETEHLKSQVAWRTIEPAVADKLVEKLAGDPSFVCIAFLYGNDESLYVARQFEQMFRRAKWQVRLEARAYPGAIITGFWISGLFSSASQDDIKEAFRAAGIAFSDGPLPAPQMTVGGGGHCVSNLVIGAKAPPVDI